VLLENKNSKDFLSSSSFKISLELEGQKRLSVNNLFSLLEHINIYGSISRAAAKLGFSYRYAWGLIQEAEKALGLSLVYKQAGGLAGGGAQLTREGSELLLQFKSFKDEVDSQLESFLGSGVTGAEPSAPQEAAARGPKKEKLGTHLLLASTMEPVETGLLDLLEQAFYQASGILVRHIAVGSGRALKIARDGRVDMVLSHAPELEEEFMQEGWGTLKVKIMANDFVLVGPENDPAGIAALAEKAGIVDVFRHLARTSSLFVSRGDYSGTHLQEQKIWQRAGIIPEGKWYIISPGVAGNLGIIRLAAEKKAYALVDRASAIVSSSSGLRLFTCEEPAGGDRPEDKSTQPDIGLKNIFSLIIVNPGRFPSVNYPAAVKFARWLCREGQGIIADFGREKFGQPLFSPFNTDDGN
jgi:tungstate transport system substrate-binding protein